MWRIADTLLMVIVLYGTIRARDALAEYSRREAQTSVQDAKRSAGLSEREKKSVFGDRLKNMMDSEQNDEDENQEREEETERGGTVEGDGAGTTGDGGSVREGGQTGGGTRGRGRGRQRGDGRQGGGGRQGGRRNRHNRMQEGQIGESIVIFQESLMYEANDACFIFI